MHHDHIPLPCPAAIRSRNSSSIFISSKYWRVICTHSFLTASASGTSRRSLMRCCCWSMASYLGRDGRGEKGEGRREREKRERKGVRRGGWEGEKIRHVHRLCSDHVHEHDGSTRSERAHAHAHAHAHTQNLQTHRCAPQTALHGPQNRVASLPHPFPPSPLCSPVSPPWFPLSLAPSRTQRTLR